MVLVLEKQELEHLTEFALAASAFDLVTSRGTSPLETIRCLLIQGSSKVTKLQRRGSNLAELLQAKGSCGHCAQSVEAVSACVIRSTATPHTNEFPESPAVTRDGSFPPHLSPARKTLSSSRKLAFAGGSTFASLG